MKKFESAIVFATFIAMVFVMVLTGLGLALAKIAFSIFAALMLTSVCIDLAKIIAKSLYVYRGDKDVEIETLDFIMLTVNLLLMLLITSHFGAFAALVFAIALMASAVFVMIEMTAPKEDALIFRVPANA